MVRLNSPADLEELRESILKGREPEKIAVTACGGTACKANRSDEVFDKFKDEIENRGMEEELILKKTGCHGFCEQGPLVNILPKEVCYTNVQPEDVPDIVSGIESEEIVERLLYVDPSTEEQIERETDTPFYQKQDRIVFGQGREIDLGNIKDYIALGGYSALAKVLAEMEPTEVLEEIKKSNLRGRGGGGFPVGIKWESAGDAPGEPKYVAANCDEGDPGAYMDRSLMEGNPHRVLEGLIIGAKASGSHKGFFYIREEYPVALENTGEAIKQAREYGFLGKDILGSGFDFDVEIHSGAGAFVSGESSALMRALEGRVGEPRMKYIHTSERGYMNRPTNLNNVESWANVPLIIERGAEWFNSIGTEGSKGTKIFSLVGKIRNTGLVEVPMGITLRELIYDIGGGIPGEKEFKAVQTGGPSGGFIPEEHLDTPVDFDELTKLGSMMGSGGMVVFDEDTCMVDMASYFIEWLQEESCGKCIPCREGLSVLGKILGRICEGRGKEEDSEKVRDVAGLMRDASLCDLGATAANPVLTVLDYFEDEVEAHIIENRCPARVCKELISFHILPENCEGCMLCLNECPVEAIEGERGEVHEIDADKCIKCGSCYEVCNLDAVEKLSGGT